MRLENKINSVILTVVAIAVLATTGIFLFVIARSAEQSIKTDLLREARMVAHSLNLEQVAALSGTLADSGSPEYLYLKKQLTNIRLANEKCRFIYLLGLNSGGQVFFYVDSEPPGSEDESPAGQIYTEADANTYRTFQTRLENVSGPSTDRWGTWVSALVPLINSANGELSAVLGMDIDARDWNNSVIARCALPFSLFLLLFFSIILFIVLMRANRIIFQSKNRLQSILDQAPELIIVHDINGNFIEVNQEACKKLGYSKEELLRMGVIDIDPEAVRGEKDKLWKRVAAGERFVFQSNHKRKDGSTYPVEVHLGPMNLGEEILVLGIISDITERKNTEEEIRRAYQELQDTQAQLIQSNKMAAVGQLAGGVAHELNNPLTGVLNNVQLIKLEAEARKDFSIGDFKELLNIVENAALRCKKITQSLLNFSHTAAGNFSLCSLNEIVEKAIELVNQELKLRNIVFQKELEPDLPGIQGDFQLLQQVIFGLISNSRWAIEQKPECGGVITVKTWHNSAMETVNVSVSDKGIGIPPENINKLFTPFFTTKEVGEGTGLGLALFYNIIKNHNGEIKVESSPGQGAKFIISLPRFNVVNRSS